MRAIFLTLQNSFYRTALLPAALLLLLGFFLLPAAAFAKEDEGMGMDAQTAATGTIGAAQIQNSLPAQRRGPTGQETQTPALDNPPVQPAENSQNRASDNQAAPGTDSATAGQPPAQSAPNPSPAQNGQGSSPLPGLQMPENTQDENYKLNQQNQPASPAAPQSSQPSSPAAKKTALNVAPASQEQAPSPIKKFFSSFNGPNIGAWISDTSPSPYISENFNSQTTKLLYISGALLILIGLALAGKTAGRKPAAVSGFYESGSGKNRIKITPIEN